MRTTTHNSRTNASGKVHGAKHNDRNFDVTKADNIDPEKTKDNEYWNCFKDKTLTFEEVELKFYEEKFSKQLEETNNNYVKNRHPERCKTMSEWKKIKQNAPEETTYQIGRKYDDQGKIIDEYVEAPKLMKVYEEFNEKLQKWNSEHGNPFTTLTKSLHVDESAPHIQVRQVWHYKDENGNFRIGQEKALAAAGVPLPFPDKPVGRRNNRKMTFDAMTRKLWIDICYNHGIEVEREPLPDGKGKKSKDKEDFVREKYEKLLDHVSKLEGELEATKEKIKTVKDEYEAEHKLLENEKKEREKLKTEIDDLLEIKSKTEYDEAVSETTQALDELQKSIAEYNNFVSELDEDIEKWNGLNVKNIAADFLFDHPVPSLAEKIKQGIAFIINRIKGIDLFEKLTHLPAFERQASKLQERLDEATKDSNAHNKTVSDVVQQKIDIDK